MRPTLMIVLAGLIAERERKGLKWCEKWGLGKRRAIVGDPLPDGSDSILPIAEYVLAQREAAAILKAACLRCQGCKLGRR